MIELRDLAVSYRTHEALAPLTHVVPRGTWACCIGPNGAGKSSALRAIAGLIPFSGCVTLDGNDSRALSRRRLSQLVALVPQQPLLPNDMSVTEYVMLGRTPHISVFGVEGANDRTAVEEAVVELDLYEFSNRLLGELSGGERQRVVLARALAQQAPVLLLDEPTSALDIGHAQQVLELVDRLRRTRGLTVVAAMHDLTMAAQYADTLLLLQRGKVTVSGAPGEVITEETLRTHYGASVRVLTDECGGVVVIPLRHHFTQGELNDRL